MGDGDGDGDGDEGRREGGKDKRSRAIRSVSLCVRACGAARNE